MGLIRGEALPEPPPPRSAAGETDWMNLASALHRRAGAGLIARSILGNRLGTLVTGGVIGFSLSCSLPVCCSPDLAAVLGMV